MSNDEPMHLVGRFQPLDRSGQTRLITDGGTDGDLFTGGYSPCPGCDVPRFSIQVWHEGEQMMQCDSQDCRVEEYRMIEPEDSHAE